MSESITDGGFIRLAEAVRLYKLDRKTIQRLVPIAELGYRSKFLLIADLESAISARLVPPKSMPMPSEQKPQRKSQGRKKRDLLG
jgi:hypothetical protein